MSGLTLPPSSDRDETPRALADLAAASRDASPSADVMRALDVAWADLHGDGAAGARASRPPVSRWGWWAAAGGLGAAAALVVALASGPQPGAPAAVPAPEIEAVAQADAEGPGSSDTPAEIGAAETPAGSPVGSRGIGADAVPLVAAVPGGPFEPPPPPPRMPSPTPASDRASTRRPDRGAPARARPEAASAATAQAASAATAPDPFVWLRGADEVEPGLGLQIVRVQVPRLRWDTGVPRRDMVEADVLMGFDGQPRAVRMVRTGGR